MNRKRLLSIIIPLLVVALGALLYQHRHVEKLWLQQFLVWIDGMGFAGVLLFMGINMLMILTFMPGLLMTLGAGFLFGLGWGIVIVNVSTTLGAALAFLIGRYLLKERLMRRAVQNEKFVAVSRVVSEEHWKIVLLTRLVPLFPFKLSNYLFGLTEIRLRDFIIGTMIGIIPITTLNVYLGSIAKDLARLINGEQSITPLQIGFYAVDVLVAVGVVYYLTRLAKRALGRKL